jgi:hypothetical protein
MPSYTKEDFIAALDSYRQGEYDSIRTYSDAFGIPKSTLYARLHTRKSLPESRLSRQALTLIEESTLVKWISRLSKADFPASLPLTLELAEEIRLNRHPLSTPSAN